MIPVTKPFLPPLEEYNSYVSDIWKRNVLTNNGPLVKELEQKLSEYLGIKNLLYLTNGTIAIQIAIKALGLKGEIITTPFSYVATTSSIVWEGCTPVFVDIDPATLNLNPALIEDAITPRTCAILATHVYGNSCDVQAIGEIAKRHNLKVIYDAAHGFGTLYKGKSIYEYGDVSTASFHATKLFHTIEGGAVFTGDPDLHKRMAYMRNFGHDGPEKFNGVGINGKNSEFHAAMGIVNLNYISKIIQKRKIIAEYYDLKLNNFNSTKPKLSPDTDYNYAYYPILVESEELLNSIVYNLNDSDIFPRRYFYPSLDQLPYLNAINLPVTSDVSRRVLCLPYFSELTNEEVDMICDLILKAQNNP